MARATRGRDLLLFNLSARDDALRQAQCQPHLLHVIPSHAMLTDALVQYLVSKKWRNVAGPDRSAAPKMNGSRRRSSDPPKRFGAEIVEQRPFVLSNDPREREKNNVALLTAGVEYDVVFVADTDGEFARDVPYQTVGRGRWSEPRGSPPRLGTGPGSATAPRSSKSASRRGPSAPCATWTGRPGWR